MVHERRPEVLDGWIERTQESGLSRELRSFGNVVRSDCAAVSAALTLPWSNRQVEGQGNRLKLIKRQMYGHANFDLLRQRVLHTG